MDNPLREFDVIVWGATGSTGRLTAEFLLEEYGLGGEPPRALGGRSASKLEEDSEIATQSRG